MGKLLITLSFMMATTLWCVHGGTAQNGEFRRKSSRDSMTRSTENPRLEVSLELSGIVYADRIGILTAVANGLMANLEEMQEFCKLKQQKYGDEARVKPVEAVKDFLERFAKGNSKNMDAEQESNLSRQLLRTLFKYVVKDFSGLDSMISELLGQAKEVLSTKSLDVQKLISSKKQPEEDKDQSDDALEKLRAENKELKAQLDALRNRQCTCRTIKTIALCMEYQQLKSEVTTDLKAMQKVVKPSRKINAAEAINAVINLDKCVEAFMACKEKLRHDPKIAFQILWPKAYKTNGLDTKLVTGAQSGDGSIDYWFEFQHKKFYELKHRLTANEAAATICKRLKAQKAKMTKAQKAEMTKLKEANLQHVSVEL